MFIWVNFDINYIKLTIIWFSSQRQLADFYWVTLELLLALCQ